MPTHAIVIYIPGPRASRQPNAVLANKGKLYARRKNRRSKSTIKCESGSFANIISRAEGVSGAAQTMFVLAVNVRGVCFESSIRARERAFDVSRRRNFVNRTPLNLAGADWARNRSLGSRFNQSDHVRDRKSEVLQGWS
jgi:hypothetical protein